MANAPANNDPSYIFKLDAPFALVGDSIASLAANRKLRVDSLGLRIGPKFSTAQLSHPYGVMSFDGANKFAQEESLDLRGKFVQIKLQGTEEQPIPLFTGIVIDQSLAPNGTHMSSRSGMDLYSVASLDFLLDRIYVDKSYTLSRGIPNAALPFNGDGGARQKNRSKEKSGDSYVFDWSSDAKEWSALDIVQYLLTNFATSSGFSWSLSGVSEYLDYINVQLNPVGLSVRQCLQQLVKPEWGFSWTVDISGDAASLKIISISDVEIKSSSTVIVPKSTLDTTLNSAVEFARYIDSVSVNSVEQSAYSFIRVYSEPVRINASFGLGFEPNGLGKDWTSELETAYASANDMQRQLDKFEPVYSRFRLTKDWAGQNQTGTPIIPYISDEETCEIAFDADASSNKPFAWEAHCFERTLPVNLATEPKNATNKRPFALLYYKKAGASTGSYVMSERVSYVETDNTHPSVGLQLLDDGPGIQLRPSYPHQLAKKDFSGKSDYTGIFDYNEAIFTGSIYTDTPISVTLPGVSGLAVARTKSVYVPGLHRWMTAPKTWLDAETQTGDSWTIERSDILELKAIASAVKAWYGRRRNTVAINFKTVSPLPYLGYVISAVYEGGAFTPAGTVISAIDYDFARGKLQVQTDFNDFDFTRIAKRLSGATDKQVSQRVSRLEDAVSNVPLRSGSGGGAAKTKIAAGTVSSGSGFIYDVTLANPLTGEALASSAVKAMPLQLNYFYAIPAGTKIVVVPLDVNALGDGSGV